MFLETILHPAEKPIRAAIDSTGRCRSPQLSEETVVERGHQWGNFFLDIFFIFIYSKYIPCIQIF